MSMKYSEMKQLADKLDNITVNSELSDDIIESAKAQNLIIVYPMRDDLLVLRGAVTQDVPISSEFVAPIPGNEIIINNRGIISVASRLKSSYATFDNSENLCPYQISLSLGYVLFKVIKNDSCYAHGYVCEYPLWDTIRVRNHTSTLHWNSVEVSLPDDKESAMLVLEERMYGFATRRIAVGYVAHNAKGKAEWFLQNYTDSYKKVSLDKNLSVVYWSALPYTPNQDLVNGREIMED